MNPIHHNNLLNTSNHRVYSNNKSLQSKNNKFNTQINTQKINFNESNAFTKKIQSYLIESHNNEDKDLGTIKLAELSNQIDQINCKINTHNLLINQIINLRDAMPSLMKSELDGFKKSILEANECPLTLIDFPVSSLNTFNEFDSSIFNDWQFCVYNIKQRYYISQYTKDGLRLAKMASNLDLKLFIDFSLAKVITFADLQLLEQCFLVENLNQTLNKALHNIAKMITTLEAELNQLYRERQEINYDLNESKCGYCY